MVPTELRGKRVSKTEKNRRQLGEIDDPGLLQSLRGTAVSQEMKQQATE